jgi:hypothetical protein
VSIDTSVWDYYVSRVAASESTGSENIGRSDISITVRAYNVQRDKLGQAAGRLFLRFPFRSCRLRLSSSRRLRSDGSRVDAAQLAEVPERPGLVGLGERPRIWRSGNNCHSGGELDGGVGGTYHLVARMPSA